jgi:DNA helicase II / ATP-dependent DNA helicase PcrA
MLNEEQQQAVNYNNGPLLIVAGAGTGKTTVVVEKIKCLINEKLAKPEDILALTFTEKAASEMEERVDKVLPYGCFQMSISTFHSFADQLLREEISHIGLNSNYKLLTQAETILFLKNRLFLFKLKYFRPLGNPHKFLNALLQHFSRLKDEDIAPNEYMKWAQTQMSNVKCQNEENRIEHEKNLELAQAYETYEQLKIKEGCFDFSDLIYYLLQLFRKRPNILSKYRQKFRHVLVDEFQDTNIAQYALIKLLCPPENNPHLTVVGDDSQAIYKFRGASVSNIINFMKDYPQAKQITLNKNYRSNQEILDIAYQTIQNNNPDTLESQLGISKKLIAKKGRQKDAYQLIVSETGEEETEKIAKEILALKAKDNYRFADFALLVRANNHADPFLGTFIYHNIPYRFLGPGMLFKQPEVKDLIAYLKILYNLEDATSLYRVLTMDIFNPNLQDISLLLSFAKKTTLSFYQALEIFLSFTEKDWYREEYEIYKKYLPLIHKETKNNLLIIVKMIKKHLSFLKKETAGQILYYFLDEIGYLKKLIAYKTEKDEKIALNVAKFLTKLKTYESEHDDASVFNVVDFIDMSLELGESPQVSDLDAVTYDAVNILTVHSAKGLEFPVVFLVNLSQGRFPTFEKKEPIPIPDELIKETLPQGDYHIEEERRLFYVAVTRAKDKIILSASQKYGEGKRERKISPFVVEALGEKKVNQYLQIKKEEKTQLSIFDFKKPTETIIRENVLLRNFSFTQLDTFKTCPLRYKYQYVLKLPTPPNAAASFGDSIHRSLQAFYLAYKKDALIGVEELLNLFKKLWIPLGYSSPSHQEQMKSEGKEMLKRFFNTFHPPENPIFDLEKLFKIRVNDNTYITGKIDRIDGTADGAIEIIDYKTGKNPLIKNCKKAFNYRFMRWRPLILDFTGKNWKTLI